MKYRSASLFLLGLVLCIARALAQDSPEELRFQQQHDQIEQERRRQEGLYAQQEAACYQRFAVNDCLREVRARRRVVMEDLRRQDILVSDEQRKLKGQEELKRLEERRSEQAIQEAEAQRAAALRDSQERQERAEQKKLDKARAEQDRLATSPQLSRDKSADRPTPQGQAQDRQAYEDKQRQAAESRARRDKALQDKAAQPPVQPLPVPR